MLDKFPMGPGFFIFFQADSLAQAPGDGAFVKPGRMRFRKEPEKVNITESNNNVLLLTLNSLL